MTMSSKFSKEEKPKRLTTQNVCAREWFKMRKWKVWHKLPKHENAGLQQFDICSNSQSFKKKWICFFAFLLSSLAPKKNFPWVFGELAQQNVCYGFLRHHAFGLYSFFFFWYFNWATHAQCTSMPCHLSSENWISEAVVEKIFINLKVFFFFFTASDWDIRSATTIHIPYQKTQGKNVENKKCWLVFG